jgi:phosphate transport system protein
MEHRFLSREEQQIRDRLVTLSETVETAIDQACDALAALDIAACEALVNNDENINKQQNVIEKEVLTTIATQQPVATDLRILVAALHISVELERIADYAAGIARTTIKIAEEQPIAIGDDILTMAESCKVMLTQAIQAYTANDAESAVDIAKRDQQVDDYETKISNDIIEQMSKNVGLVPFGSRLLWIVHAIERIGDRVTNICEQIAYIKYAEVLDLNG